MLQQMEILDSNHTDNILGVHIFQLGHRHCDVLLGFVVFLHYKYTIILTMHSVNHNIHAHTHTHLLFGGCSGGVADRGAGVLLHAQP